MDINEWITCSVKQNASDLHLCSGYPPMWRIDGELQPIQTSACCNAAQLERWGESWMMALQRQQLHAEGQADGALTTPDGVRLRAHLFRQHAGLSVALRTIATTAHALETLHAPLENLYVIRVFEVERERNGHRDNCSKLGAI